MITVEEIEPIDPRPYYMVTGTCDSCGVLFLKHRTHTKPDTTRKVYCMECQRKGKDNANT